MLWTGGGGLRLLYLGFNFDDTFFGATGSPHLHPPLGEQTAMQLFCICQTSAGYFLLRLNNGLLCGSGLASSRSCFIAFCGDLLLARRKQIAHKENGHSFPALHCCVCVSKQRNFTKKKTTKSPFETDTKRLDLLTGTRLHEHLFLSS